MKFSKTLGPVAYPVALSDAKAQCVVEHIDDDIRIVRNIAQATDYAELFTGLQLMTQTWTNYFDCWASEYELPFRPVQSVAIMYTDEAGNEQVLPADQYLVDIHSYPAKVQITGIFPILFAGYNTVRIDVVCGYENSDTIPDGIKAAIYLMIGHLYANLEASTPIKTDELPLGVHSFLTQHRIDFF